MKFKAVIFDLDGTLLDTIDDLADSMNSVLERHGFPEHGIDKYKYFVGDGIDVLVRRALPIPCGDESFIEECITQMKREYDLRWADKTRPYDGVPELLDAFSASGARLSILSNKPHGSTCVVVSKMLANWKFEMVVGARDGVPKKPDPSSAISISESFGLATGEFLYIGDTGTDMKTAVSAGMFPAGVLWGFRPAGELVEAGARILVRYPADLLQFI
ncbi:MAG: HAD family hydrolase [Desulfobacteraceae bacterium]|nr:MAG: HAD family hydrolase [Desulfobacteraceae bacterium]